MGTADFPAMCSASARQISSDGANPAAIVALEQADYQAQLGAPESTVVEAGLVSGISPVIGPQMPAPSGGVLCGPVGARACEINSYWDITGVRSPIGCIYLHQRVTVASGLLPKTQLIRLVLGTDLRHDARFTLGYLLPRLRRGSKVAFGGWKMGPKRLPSAPAALRSICNRSSMFPPVREPTSSLLRASRPETPAFCRATTSSAPMGGSAE
jgi:hypothetical protein